MIPRILLPLALLALAPPAAAQRSRVTVSSGEVVHWRGTRETRRTEAADRTRFAPRVPGLTPELAARLKVDADSAQRIALDDFDWRGRVGSIEVDEEDARLYWDVKIVPDSTSGTILRYRVDAVSGGILGIREFTGVRGLARAKTSRVPGSNRPR